MWYRLDSEGSCEYGNELLNSIKCFGLLKYLD
jgi:hypothetical protein